MNEADFSTITLPDPPKSDPLRSYARKSLAVAAAALAAVTIASVIYARKHQESDSETGEAPAEEVASA